MATPKVHRFQLIEGMQLQISVSGSSNAHNVRAEFYLKNCTRTWILHWGFLYRGNTNWFIPFEQSSRQGALQTPFVKSGDAYVVIIELRDPKIHAIEFVLKDGSHNRWLKLDNGNFRIEIPQNDANASHPPMPKDLIARRAYEIWERKGRPKSSPQQQQQDYENALRELQSELSKGMSLNVLQSGNTITNTKAEVSEAKQLVSPPASLRRKHNVEKWLQKYSEPQERSANGFSSALMDLVKKYLGGDNVVSQQSYRVGNHEMVVLSRNVKGDFHVLIATNMRGSAVLHWGVSESSSGEWLIPPSDMLPAKSKLVNGACQTHFMDISTREGFYKIVYLNLGRRDFVGIQFVIWLDGSWIKNNGANFFVSLKSKSATGKIDMGGNDVLKWLLDEISQRETEAERSLMHRFNIAMELTERCKGKGELGLIGIMVWIRFMACGHLMWNKNYNVKPREISEALVRFTNLLHRIYLNHPNNREIVRLIMAFVGRGGQGDVGQRIRDEILVIQRNNNCKSGMIEEWHQKLHNNSSPDDIIICEALLNYVRSDFSIGAYWKTLNANGLTKEKLASYDRPIVSEPRFRSDAKEGLIRDLTMYLKTLKTVHSGADLESAIETLVSPFKGHNVTGVDRGYAANGLSPKLQKLLEARIELFPVLRAPHTRAKDLLFLDIALESTVRTTMERELKSLNFTNPQGILFYISLLLENLCLSTINNEETVYCTKEWYHVCEAYKPKDVQWALHTKAILDRLQLVLADKCQYYHKRIQPTANYLGHLLGVQKGVIDAFTEEVVRAGPGAVLSTLITRFDPILRNFANLGCWQVISSADVSGYVVCVNELITIQNKVYSKPTVVIAHKVSGEEEIPDGVVAVLTPSMTDVLSHVSIRARNSKVCFATCFDQNILRDLKSKEGKAISIQAKPTDLVISHKSGSSVSVSFRKSFSIPRGITSKRKTFCGKYAISFEEFTAERVGAKSCNIKFLKEKVPSWIKIPTAAALPFGTFESILGDHCNKDVAEKISSLKKLVSGGDLSKLQAIREAILQMNAPISLINELKTKMISARMPGTGKEESWNRSWRAIKKVWASKWNERAYISCKKTKLNHDDVCMAVLIQEVVCGDYAFAIHTKNPVSGDSLEIYTEIVKGLGETLVGAYPGRAMCFIAKKNNLKSPTVVTYPSKQIGLYSKPSVIFRSDSNSEDLEGYAGAGLYDSVLIDEAEPVVLDYSNERMIIDKDFQVSLFSRIAETGKIIESLCGRAQDIEGVVRDGNIYVVQSRPQV